MAQPKVRIKGFDGEWNESSFDSLFDVINDRLSNVARSDYKDTGRYPIVDQSKEYVVGYTNGSNPIIPEEGLVVFGDHTREFKYIDFPFYTGADGTRVLKSKDASIKEMFLYYYCCSLQIPNTGYNRHFKYLKESEFNVPTKQDERNTLGHFFKTLDSLIQTTTKKIASLKQLKSASLLSMFPQNGEKAPRVRFKGFDGEWTQCSFGKIGKAYSGLTGKSKEDFGSGNARYITFLNVLTNAQIDTSILEHVNVQRGEHQNEVMKGDMFFNTSSETPEEVGMCSVMNENLSNVYLNSFCFGFRLIDDNINPLYIAYLMRSPIGRKIMMVLAQGATRYNLSKSGLYKAIILVPESKNEQDKIANYLSSLDSQISIQEQRLEKLKQLKAACLEKMFV